MWTSLRFDAAGGTAAIVVPAPPGSSLDWSSEAWFEANGRPMPRFAQLDVTDRASWAEMAREVGPVDILVNNAGVNIRGPAEELSEADWDAVVAVNLKAPFLVARRLGPGMCSRGWGRSWAWCSWTTRTPSGWPRRAPRKDATSSCSPPHPSAWWARPVRRPR